MNFPYYSDGWIKLFSSIGYNYLSSHDYLIKDKFSAPKRAVVEFLTFIGLKRFFKESLVKVGFLKQI